MSNNNLYNATVSTNKKNTSNAIYNNSTENKIIQDTIDKINNDSVSSMVSSGEILCGTSETQVNVKNITNTNSDNKYDFNQIINNDPYITSSYTSGKKYTDGLEKKDVYIEEEPEPTKVDSDPEKPVYKNEKVLSNVKALEIVVPKKKYSFSLDDLYYSVKPINTDTNKYINSLNGEYVNPKYIIGSFKNGIVVENQVRSNNSMPTYKVISSEYLQQETIPNDSDINMSLEKIKHKTIGQDIIHHQSVGYEYETTDINKYIYNFSLDNICVSQNLISKVAGFISAEIDVSNCGWIELEADNNDSVEFYIIEERNETPILPIGVNKINHEKLFYGLMPRFTVAEPNNISVYKNNELIAINNMEDLCLFLSVNNTNIEVNQSSYLQENEYNISYIPDKSASVYYPKTDKIRLKVIKRNITDLPVEDIKLIKIHKYNNSINWTLSRLEEISIDAPPSSSQLYN